MEVSGGSGNEEDVAEEAEGEGKKLTCPPTVWVVREEAWPALEGKRGDGGDGGMRLLPRAPLCKMRFPPPPPGTTPLKAPTPA